MRLAAGVFCFKLEVELSWGWFTFTAPHLVSALYDGACTTHGRSFFDGHLHDDGTLELWAGHRRLCLELLPLITRRRAAVMAGGALGA
jgi:hypothetical protein